MNSLEIWEVGIFMMVLMGNKSVYSAVELPEKNTEIEHAVLS